MTFSDSLADAEDSGDSDVLDPEDPDGEDAVAAENKNSFLLDVDRTPSEVSVRTGP